MTGGDDDSNFLPGFAELCETRESIARMTDAEIDERFPENTGANLLSSNPRLYRVAARLFFEFSLSQREIAVICQISRQTVAGIIAAETGSYSTRVQRTARLNRIRNLQERTFSTLEGMLSDPATVRKAGPVAVANIYKMLSEEVGELERELSKPVTIEGDCRVTSEDKSLGYLEP